MIITTKLLKNSRLPDKIKIGKYGEISYIYYSEEEKEKKWEHKIDTQKIKKEFGGILKNVITA